MHLFEILVLMGFCLVFTKAKSETDDTLDDFFNDQSDIADEVKDKLADNTADEAPKAAEDPKKNVRRLFFPRPPTITLPIVIPSNVNSPFFRACYCFKRRCFGNYFNVYWFIYICT